MLPLNSKKVLSNRAKGSGEHYGSLGGSEMSLRQATQTLTSLELTGRMDYRPFSSYLAGYWTPGARSVFARFVFLQPGPPATRSTENPSESSRENNQRENKVARAKLAFNITFFNQNLEFSGFAWINLTSHVDTTPFPISEDIGLKWPPQG